MASRALESRRIRYLKLALVTLEALDRHCRDAWGTDVTELVRFGEPEVAGDDGAALAENEYFGEYG